VFHYAPSHKRFGVDEVLEDDGFTTFYRFGSADFTESAAQFLGLLRAAGP
jgi:hypothetical protein